MAKKRSGITKTQAIKEALEKFPDLGPKEISRRLTSRGVKVSPAYVSTIKTSLRKTGQISIDKRSKSRTSANGAPPSGYVAVSALVQARELIEKAGGVDEAREALAVVAKLN